LCPFDGSEKVPQAKVYKRDARNLPFEDGSIDVVITSPPYLNAIDYLRGHRMSLVWMGHRIGQLREVRSSNVGAEVGFHGDLNVAFFQKVFKEMGVSDRTSERLRRMLARYAHDMDAILSETARVLTGNGQAVFVVGDSTIGGTFIRNSKAIAWLGKKHGLDLVSTRRRQLPNNRRYLPPPSSKGAGEQLGKRMREEVIVSFRKTA
jgi:ubiquinone/menaquinone biosynthesis C-methylase UbiE